MYVELLIEAHLAHVQAMKALKEKAAGKVSDGPLYVLLSLSRHLLPPMSYKSGPAFSRCHDQPWTICFASAIKLFVTGPSRFVLFRGR
jgi:hypothetical protein